MVKKTVVDHLESSLTFWKKKTYGGWAIQIETNPMIFFLFWMNKTNKMYISIIFSLNFSDDDILGKLSALSSFTYSRSQQKHGKWWGTLLHSENKVAFLIDLLALNLKMDHSITYYSPSYIVFYLVFKEGTVKRSTNITLYVELKR